MEKQSGYMTTQPTNSKIGNVIRVSSGNFLEMYDFMVYAYYASYIAREIFPASNAYASLMLTLGTFGAGFDAAAWRNYSGGVHRPGRAAGGANPDILLMAIGTLAIACAPGYWTIGILAPLLVVLGRLLQGFSAGVELGGVSVYFAEIATPAVGDFTEPGNRPASRSLWFSSRFWAWGSARHAARGHGTVGLARSIFYWLPDCAAAVLAAQVSGGDRSVSRAKAPSRNFGNTCFARVQLEDRCHRRFTFHHDHSEFLSDHRLYADIRDRSVAPHQPSKPDGDFLRGHVEFFLVAHGWSDFR